MAIPRTRTAAQLIDAGKPRQAIVLLEDLTTRFPFYAVPFVLLARAREAVDEADGALRAWQQAHFLLPENPVVQDGIARCTRRLLDSRERPIIDDRVDFELASADQIEVSVLSVAYPSASGPGIDDVIEALDEAEADPSPAPQLRPLDTGREIRPGPAFLSLEENLDDLIAQLSSARIEPRSDLDAHDDPIRDTSSDPEEVVSETLARIYENQQKFAEAARVYRLLADQHPDRAGTYRRLADELDPRIDGSDDRGDV